MPSSSLASSFPDDAHQPPPADQHALAARSGSVLAAALNYAERGWAVLPVYRPMPNGACSCGDPHDNTGPTKLVAKSIGKHPVTKQGSSDASKDPATIRRWFGATEGKRNVGIATGRVSGLIVIDVDGDEGETELSDLGAEYGEPPETLAQETGRDDGGRHLIFSVPDTSTLTIRQRQLVFPNGTKASHIDVRGDGGYIIGAPSLHRSGKTYAFADPSLPLATVPEWVYKQLTAIHPATPAKTYGDRRTVTEDEAKQLGLKPELLEQLLEPVGADRSSQTYRIVNNLVWAGRSDDDIRALVYSLHKPTQQRGQKGDVERCIAHSRDAKAEKDGEWKASRAGSSAGHSKPPSKPSESPGTQASNVRPLTLVSDDPTLLTVLNPDEETEAANGARLARAVADTHLFVIDRREWWVHTDGRWVADQAKTIEVAAEGIAESYATEIILSAGETKVVPSKWRKTSLSGAGIRNATRAAERSPVVQARSAEFDDPDSGINTPSGVVNPRTGHVAAHHHTQRLTLMTRGRYEPGCGSDLWQSFLHSTLDSEDATYLQVELGRSLAGAIEPHRFHLIVGGGRNGKGLFFDTIVAAIGDYGATAQSDIVLSGAGSSRDSAEAMSRLVNKRVVFLDETEDEGFLRMSTVKRITGGSEQQTRELYVGWGTTRPTQHFYLSTQYPPSTSDHSVGAVERLRVVEFTRDFSGANGDNSLKRKLSTQAVHDSILTWLVDGAMAFYGQGETLPTSRAIDLKTSEYFEDSNAYRTFLKERTIRHPSGSGKSSERKAVYEAFTAWARANGLYARTMPAARTVYKHLQREGIVYKQSNSRHLFADLTLKGHPVSNTRADDFDY